MEQGNPLRTMREPALDARGGDGPATDDADEPDNPCDKVVDAIGMRSWQWLLVFLMGVLIAADSAEATLLAYLNVCVGHAFGLSTFKAASVVAVVFAGEIAGAIIAGAVSDEYGRKGVSLVCCAAVAVFGFASAFAPNFSTFVLLRFFVGVGLGSGAVPYDLLAEMIPAASRGRALIWVGVGWAVGTLYTTGMAWLILPRASWRMLAVVCALPTALIFPVLAYALDESPRWLLEAGRTLDAVAVFRRLADKSGAGGDAKVDAAIRAIAADADAPPPKEHPFGVVACKRLAAVLAQWRLSLRVWVIWFSLGAVYYGSTLTIARTFDKNDDDDDVRCRFRYDVIFSIFTASLVGKAIAIQLIDVVGRVRMICAACLAYVAFFLPIAVGVDSFTGRYISLYGVLAGAVVAGSCAWVQIPELYRTEIRSTAHTLAYIVSRFGASFAAYVVEGGLSISTAACILIAAAVAAGATTSTLHETSGMRLDSK